jgi:hypothetical protein
MRYVMTPQHCKTRSMTQARSVTSFRHQIGLLRGFESPVPMLIGLVIMRGRGSCLSPRRPSLGRTLPATGFLTVIASSVRLRG